ncbi:ABC-type Fe3+-hydroxamate transport system, periplasmic component [Thioflavicoccus mobilis 8321]|uniref:ABC-type Fe3+-hydroxamate transport system, periplasmic component n=1 Tax=Thioflavicoccus mobilis 8321 TaxID=765912 RepID=L0GYK9_9GAMM|nr:ABC transporter substrate-binding protein [Thioflavicoccus mobilis]AGA91863.1 ABC-type Fe3+-hydroxamate transport system, periplasmic component [Thioflavicoccus mobilis 8321]
MPITERFRPKILPSLLGTLLGGLLVLATSAQARELVDMKGRTVAVPDQVDKVLTTAPPTMPLVYVLDPARLTAMNFAVKAQDVPYFSPLVQDLPVIGRYLGDGPLPQREAVLAAGPELGIAWDNRFVDADGVEKTFVELGIPGLYVRVEHLADYPEALALVGRAIGREARAAELGAYIEEAIAEVTRAVADVPPGERPRVYFAEGPNGLISECAGAFHAEAIVLAGGENVLVCEQKALCGLESVTLDQVRALDPDLILIQSPKFYAAIQQDPAWADLQAVREGRFYQVPTTPFNWMGRPPSFMRALAIQWLANRFYPERFPWDREAETRTFYQLFLGVEPSDAQLAEVLAGS